MMFIKVINPIKAISSKEVTFQCGPNRETFLRRLHNRKIIWKLMDDGIYIRREFVEAYGLSQE